MVEQGPGNSHDQSQLPKPGEFRRPTISPEEARDEYREVLTTILERNRDRVRPVPDEPEEIRSGGIITSDE